MTTRGFFDDEAGVGSEEDESFDEETGEVHTKKANGVNGHIDDSSEEEDDDDDDEAARAVREGFIVDEDEDDEAATERRKKEKRKRRREDREEEGLDEEDLDLIGQLEPDTPQESKFKRLKRGHREDAATQPRGVDDIFSDENDDLVDEVGLTGPGSRNALAGEFDDFIEQDEPDDDEGGEDAEVKVGPRASRGLAAVNGMEVGLDEASLEDMRAAFGDGTEYDWALELQENMDDQELDPEKQLELKDVFEPSQLIDKMLTDEDNDIRATDVPERFQLARRTFAEEELSPEEQTARIAEESLWISQMMWPKKRFDRDILEPFQKSIASVLEFANVDNLEVPFIFQHRKDYLIHAARIERSPDPANQDGPAYEVRAEKLLNQGDLWEVLELDLKFRALLQKRQALQRAYDGIKEATGKPDEAVEAMLPAAMTMEEVQDIQDYLRFQYSSEIKDAGVGTEVNGQKRARASADLFERIRALPSYNVVRGFGVSPDAFAQSMLEENRRGYTDDPQERPDDMADQYVDGELFSTGAQVLSAAKKMFAEELAMSPRMRKLFRKTYYTSGLFDCVRTEKGLRKIDEEHPFYEFKYLRSQSLGAIARRPELYLSMLKAEADGLVEVRLKLDNKERFRRKLQENLESDNFSEVADAWNSARKEVLNMALEKLEKIMVKSVKENLRTECENQVGRSCREEYSKKLDQAPYKPKGMILGTLPRVLAFTNGRGSSAKDAIHWTWTEHDGRMLESGIYADLRLGNSEKGLPDGPDVERFIELVKRRKPDVIGVSGFSVEARSLYKDIQAIIDRENLRGNEYDDEDGDGLSDKVEAVVVNDEVARLYHQSDRAKIEYPSLTPLTRYCVALARYMQNPLKEYASLGRDITSITFDPNQNLIPHEKLAKHLETAMVDMVNLVGVEINEAVSDSYTQNLLPYVCGLGPRKAAAMVQAINRNGGIVTTRSDLVGGTESARFPAVTANIFQNCASFLYVEYEAAEPTSNYLDNTRIHPEDYDIAKKMAADAMELDEEDVQAEIQENGDFAVLRRLVKEDAQERVNDLILESYAENLETVFHTRKRATLETIRAELNQPYEELRRSFVLLPTEEIFTMFTGETRDSLVEGMIMPITIRRVFPDHMECKLDCGIEGGISEAEFPEGVGMDGVEPRVAFKPHQTVQAKLIFLNRKQLTAQLSLREDSLRRPYHKEIDREPGEWDEKQEDTDKRAAEKRRVDSTGRMQRQINHPNFRNWSSEQAEEFLGPRGRGDVIIRPSKKGADHLVVTWKVADNIFQHIDVLEMDKENEFSVGKHLKIGGKYDYSDLDELIDSHVKPMSKKVDQITADERYKGGSKAETHQWLSAYMEANPRRSMYAFSINRDNPGYFWLSFKPDAAQPPRDWVIKLIPNAFELQKNPYPNMMALKNGFKTLIQNKQQLAMRNAPARRPGY